MKVKEKRKKKNYVSYGGFSYKLDRTESGWLYNSETDKEYNLKERYLIFVKYQGSKGYTINYITYEIFEKIVSDVDCIVDTYIEEIKKPLNTYINNMDKIVDKYTSIEFRNSVNYDLYLAFRVVSKDTVKVLYIDNLKTIKETDKEFVLRPNTEYSMDKFIYETFRYRYFPTDNMIFEFCRKISGEYFALCKYLRVYSKYNK